MIEFKNTTEATSLTEVMGMAVNNDPEVAAFALGNWQTLGGALEGCALRSWGRSASIAAH